MDASSFVKIGKTLFKLLDAPVDEKRDKNVVQVVPNIGNNQMLAGMNFI